MKKKDQKEMNVFREIRKATSKSTKGEKRSSFQLKEQNVAANMFVKKQTAPVSPPTGFRSKDVMFDAAF